MNSETLKDLDIVIEKFVTERDWNKYHTPKNLLLALQGEIGELSEIFQWLSTAESLNLSLNKKSDVEDELADVFIYLLRLSNVLDVNLIESAFKKIEKNKLKYPIDKSFGNAKKYNEL